MRSRIPAHHRVIQGALRAAIRISTLARNAGPAMVFCFLLLTAGAAWLTWSASAQVWELKSWNRLFGGSAQPPSSGASSMHARPEDKSGGTYTVIDNSGAGTSVGTGTFVGGIDAAGDVTGLYLDNNHAAHSFLRMANGTLTPINAPNAGQDATQGTFALNIDPTGSYITGMYADSNNVYHGFLFQTANDTLTSLDVSGAGTTGHRGTVALSVNSTGTVVGTYITGSATSGTTYYNGFARTLEGTVTTISTPDAGTGNQEGTVATSINASGGITGVFYATKQVPFGFVRNTAGTITEFGVDCQGSGTTDCYGTIPMSIDAAGDVTGTSRSGVGASALSHGFVRAANGTITTFDPEGSVAGGGEFTGTLPLGIDPGGNYITGLYTDSSGLAHGFVRSTSDGTITSFDAPAAATTLTFLIAGTGGISVNESGETAGTYLDANSIFHGFVLTPAASTSAATPTFSPAAGTYTSAQAVAISDATPGATIYYTTNGTTPTTSSTVYSGPVTVSSETLEAIATADGYTQSSVATAAYAISLPTAATPAFSPTAGVYSSAQTVTISDATSGAAIYYTTNGTTPTASSSVYSAPLSVSSTETLEAIATASGYSPSAAASAAYTIGPPFSMVLASGSSTTATVQPGGIAVYTLTIAPTGSTTFPAAITFSASGLPSGATATFAPSTIAAGAGTTTVTLSIQTSSSSAMLRQNKAPWAFALCLLLVPLAGVRRRKTAIWRASDIARSLFLLLLLCGAAVGLGGCSGSGGGGGSSPHNYAVTVTATSGQAQQTTTVRLTVE